MITNEQNSEQNVPIEEFDPWRLSEHSKTTNLDITFILTNIYLNISIFSFAVRAKSFGLIWVLLSTIIVGIINYWTFTRLLITSSKYKEDDYSEITERILGRKARVILNILIIIYSYACMICFLSLLFPLFGRFLMSGAFRENYESYEQFELKAWGLFYIKYPFYVGISIFIFFMCIIKGFNNLKFSNVINIIGIIYTLLVITIQCHDYYKNYKNNGYKKDDKSTYLNLFNISNGFNEELNFFKGITNLFFSFTWHHRIFPIIVKFNSKINGWHKMKIGVFYVISLTTILHIIAIICSFLIDPITPKDLILYRKNIGEGKDILMTLAKLLTLISIIFNLPGYQNTLRQSIENTFIGEKLSNKFNNILTFISIFSCATIAAFYDKFLNYLSYIGGFICVFIYYLFPILIYVHSSGKSPFFWKNFIELFFAIFLCFIGIIAGIATLIDDIKN